MHPWRRQRGTGAGIGIYRLAPSSGAVDQGQACVRSIERAAKRPGHRIQQGGFSLVEVIVALSLFALIGVAGYSMLSGVLQTQERTSGRLERLSEIQRALFIITTDLDQAASRPEGGRSDLVLRKTATWGQSVLIRYDVQGEGIIRTVSTGSGERSQVILSDVGSLGFSYFRRGEGWTRQARALPISGQAPLQTNPTEAPGPGAGQQASGDLAEGSENPLSQQQTPVSAIAIDVELTGVDGRSTSLRRIVTIPEVRT